MKKFREIAMVFIIVLVGLINTGCKSKEGEIKKIRDLDFTVVDDEDIPGELKEIIDEKKENPFKLSYSNKDYLYIVVGYGMQDSGGYSISVDDLFLASNAVYIKTDLIGPSEDDIETQGVSYPYIVVKLEFIDEKIVFE